MRSMSDALIEPFGRAHLDGLIALVAAEGWTEYVEDTERTWRALSAPGYRLTREDLGAPDRRSIR